MRWVLIWSLLTGALVMAFGLLIDWKNGKRIPKEGRFWKFGSLWLMSSLVLFWLLHTLALPIVKNPSHTKPEFRADFVIYSLGEHWQTGNATGTAFVRIINAGSPSIVESWFMTVILPNGKSYRAKIPLSPAHVDIQGQTNENAVVLKVDKYLPALCQENPIPQGGARVGWVAFQFNELIAKELDSVGTKYVLSLRDCTGATNLYTFDVQSSPRPKFNSGKYAWP